MSKTTAIDCYLIVRGKRRWKTSGPIDLVSPRVTKTKPATKKDEVAIKVHLSLPEALFDEPQFQASIEVNDSQCTSPTVDAAVLNNIEELVREQTGICLTITDSREQEDEPE